MFKFSHFAAASFSCIISVYLMSPSNGFCAEQPKPVDGKTVFEQKCLTCHKPEKFKSQRNDRKGWDLILSRMERNSCKLSEEERAAVADFLAKKYGE